MTRSHRCPVRHTVVKKHCSPLVRFMIMKCQPCYLQGLHSCYCSCVPAPPCISKETETQQKLQEPAASTTNSTPQQISPHHWWLQSCTSKDCWAKIAPTCQFCYKRRKQSQSSFCTCLYFTLQWCFFHSTQCHIGVHGARVTFHCYIL